MKKKNYLIIGITLVVALLIASAGYLITARANGGTFALNLFNLNGSNNASATTTRSTLHSGLGSVPEGTEAASTTLSVYTERTGDVELNMTVVGSSTTHRIEVSVEFSMNGIDYYRRACSQTNSAATVVTVGNRCIYSWEPGVAATSSASILVENIAAKYTRFIFGSSRATSTIYAEAVLKDPTN